MTASPQFILAQCLSLVALCSQITAGQVSRVHIMMRLNGLTASCMMIHFLLMGVVVAATIVAVSAVRSFTMSTNTGQRFKNFIVPVCMALAVSGGAYLAQEPWMLVCLGPPIVWGTAEYIGKTDVMRPAGFVCSSLWLFNNLMSVSVGGVAMNLLVMSSFGISMLRQAEMHLWFHWRSKSLSRTIR